MQTYKRHRGKTTFSIVSRQSNGTSCSMHARLNACRARVRGFAARPSTLEFAETWNREMSESVGKSGDERTRSLETLDKCFACLYIGTHHVQRRVEHPLQLRETNTAC